MPSDLNESTLDQVRLVLADAQSSFRSAVAATAESLRGTLAERTQGASAKEAVQAAQLGNFAAGRMDIGAFSSFAEPTNALQDDAVPILQQAQIALEQIVEAGTDLFEVEVEAGNNIRCAVNRALGQIGRAFAAARIIELAQSGNYQPKQHAELLESFRFAHWSAAERRLAPPLLVRVQGRGLQASALTELLDGRQKFVLLLEGTAGPAPLARSISPNTYVLQCQSPSDLAGLVQWNGPGIAALVSEPAALFCHDPQGGSDLSDRLQILNLPQPSKFKALGSLSAAQQSDHLAHLVSLSHATASAEPESTTDQPSNPVDQLAAFLLNRAHLEEV
jgi:hypothetical protein